MAAPKAIVREVDGVLVLDDPDARGVAIAVAKHNCRLMLKANRERVEHFDRRMRERGALPTDVIIIIINVDDPHGGPIAEALMPDCDWRVFRDRGETPVARGLAGRAGVEDAIERFDEEAARKLRMWSGVAVVVIDHGVAEVFSPGDADGE